MKISIITHNNLLEHKVSILLKNFFNKFSSIPLVTFFFKEFSIVALDNENVVYILNNNKKEKIFFECQVKEAFIFIVENFFKKNELKFCFKYDLINIGYEIGIDLKTLFKITGWQQDKRGKDYFFTLSEFSDILKAFVLQEKLSINEAFNFHRIIGRKGDIFLQKIPSLLTFSEMNKVIQYFIEIYNKTKDIDSIILKLDFSNKILFLESIKNLRYSNYYYYKKKFEEYIKNLNLPKGVIVKYDENFESDEYQLIINFKSKEKLLDKIEDISKSLKKDKKDFFIYKDFLIRSKK